MPSIHDLVRLLALAGGALLLSGHAADRDQDPQPDRTPPATAAHRLAWLTELAGDWVERLPDGKPGERVVTSFRVTAGGHAVVETVFPGQAHEMVTVYHLDGGRLALTHYCVAGNRPHMIATAASRAERIEFRCDGAGGIEAEAHMHDGLLERPAPDRLRTRWTMRKGDDVLHVAEFDAVRRQAGPSRDG